MGEQILSICEDKSDIQNFFFNIQHVSKRTAAIDYIRANDLKKTDLNKYSLVFVYYEHYSFNEINKIVEYIKKDSATSDIIILSSNITSVEISNLYERGVYEFININSPLDEIEIKLLNCLKFQTLKKQLNIMSVFINLSDCKNVKTDLYKHKALKEAFDYLKDMPNYKNSCYVIMALSDSVKTKISMNRLAINLKKMLRQSDIVAQGVGKFYILLSDANFDNAKCVVQKISDSMGENIKLNCGITEICYKCFEQAEKLANDALKSAIINNELYMSFSANNTSVFEGNSFNEKHFKLFNKAYNLKMAKVLEPLFMRFEQQCSYKLPKAEINQYSNEFESVFSLKENNFNSKLIMTYDGFAKMNVKIIHCGLETPENFDCEVPLNKLDEKFLSKILNKLYTEFLEAEKTVKYNFAG